MTITSGLTPGMTTTATMTTGMNVGTVGKMYPQYGKDATFVARVFFDRRGRGRGRGRGEGSQGKEFKLDSGLDAL